jgi:hypothetical protein
MSTPSAAGQLIDFLRQAGVERVSGVVGDRSARTAHG